MRKEDDAALMQHTTDVADLVLGIPSKGAIAAERLKVLAVFDRRHVGCALGNVAPIIRRVPLRKPRCRRDIGPLYLYPWAWRL